MDLTRKIVYYTPHAYKEDFVSEAIRLVVDSVEECYRDLGSLHILYMNATNPNQLNSIMMRCKLEDKYEWMKDDTMMKEFRYERISNLNEVIEIIEKNEIKDIIIIENLQLIINNSFNEYNELNLKIVKLFKLLKMKTKQNSIVIDLSHHSFINYLL